MNDGQEHLLTGIMYTINCKCCIKLLKMCAEASSLTYFIYLYFILKLKIVCFCMQIHLNVVIVLRDGLSLNKQTGWICHYIYYLVWIWLTSFLIQLYFCGFAVCRTGNTLNMHLEAFQFKTKKLDKVLSSYSHLLRQKNDSWNIFLYDEF